MASVESAWLDAGRDWETDQVVEAKRSERRAWWFAALGGITAMAACVAVALLTPLKSVEPFVVRVDQTTGATDIITLLDQKSVRFSEVIDKYWLAQYVNFREEYSNASAYPFYQAVSLMSSRPVAEAYFAQISPQNPRAPVNVYGKDGQVEVLIRSIAFLGNDVAQVRFSRAEKATLGEPSVTYWIATITYRYLTSPMLEKDRLINPLGFQCTDYRLDPEALASVK